MPSAELVDVARHEITALLLAMARFTGLLLVMPTFPKSLLPNLVRVGLILSLGIVQQRVLSLGGAVEDLGMFMLVTLLIKEVMLGGAMGFLFGVVFWGAEAAGFFIDNHRGAAIASSINPLTGSDTAPLGIFFGQLLTVYFFVSGAFLALIGLVYDSYAIFPVLEFLPTLPPETVPFFLGVADKVMYLSIVLAGPVVIAMFIAEFALALVSRFAPQLNVFVLSMPLKSGVGFFILALFVPFLIGYLGDTLREHPALLQDLGTLLR
jgi:type III secretion protein T